MSINTVKYIEAYIKIKDKNSNIIDFKLNEPQIKLYNIIREQHRKVKPIRIIILKARQMGFSTLTEAIIFKNTTTKCHISSGIITHQDTATNNLFNMSKLMYNNLPTEMQPDIKNSNAKELIFDKADGSGLGSKIKCMTAGSHGVGRSDTFNNLHISELAFWQGNKNEILTGLLQAVPNNKDSMIIIESTANGYDEFKKLWDMANKGENDFIPIFVGWNELDEYKMLYDGFQLTDEELTLKELYCLTNEQLSWRRWCIRNNCSNDIEQFKQEYPINPQEAFISTGTCIFDKEEIIKRVQKINDPIKCGYFAYETFYSKSDNEIFINDKTIKWVNDSNGYIKIYEDKKNNYPYVIGGDTSGDGSDNFTGQVLDNTSEKQVAVLKRQFDEDIYAKQMYCLGRYYNNALIGIETNFSTYPNKELERLKYPNLYVREREDNFTHKIVQAYGFNTTSKTRPIIISQLVEVFRDNINSINDQETLEEGLTFIRNEKGRPEAQYGSHDDLIMGLAIAHYIRTQQSHKLNITKHEKRMKKELTFDFDAEEEDGDYGMSISII